MPVRSAGGHHADIEVLNARIRALQADIANLEEENSTIRASAAGYRADFERERERSDTIMAEALRLTNLAMLARETAARLEGEIAALHSRPWWRRFAG
jgi:chromosome segregation ATPase